MFRGISCGTPAIVGLHKQTKSSITIYCLPAVHHHQQLRTVQSLRQISSTSVGNRSCMWLSSQTQRKQFLRYSTNTSFVVPLLGKSHNTPRFSSSLIFSNNSIRQQLTKFASNYNSSIWCRYICISTLNSNNLSNNNNSQHFHNFNDSTQNNATMKLSQKTKASIALIVTAATVLSFQEPIHICHAERYRFFSSSSSSQARQETASSSSDNESDKDLQDAKQWVESSTSDNVERHNNTQSACPFYGCPLRPVDVHYNTAEYKEAFTIMRNDKRVVVQQTDAAKNILSSSANEQHATFTLIGYKGGDLQGQINQDRAVVVAPYTVVDNNSSNNTMTQSNLNGKHRDSESLKSSKHQQQLQNFIQSDRILLGVFDGHAPLGEKVSEYVTVELPKLLANKLLNKANRIVESSNSTDKTSLSVLTENEIVELTKSALSETFVELDRTAPAHPSGGCTASIVLKQGRKVYVANVGDSRSFVVAYRPSTKNVSIAYISREDKPCLPDERARVEALGGQVYIPTRGTSRVVFHDPTTGAPTGLAMSRSIGDWEAGKMGVIPDPIVDVLDIHTVVANVLLDDMDDEQDADSYQVNPMLHKVDGAEDDVYIFAVSATDGMMDYLSAIDIARVLAHSLFDDSGAHPVTALEHLIFAAANAWQEAKQGRYRDDIAIAVSVLRQPKKKKSSAIVDPDGNINIVKQRQ